MHARIPLFACLLFFLSACSPDAGGETRHLGETEDGWRPLFDGESLTGWTNPYDWGEAWVEDGEIRLLGDQKFFLVTEEEFADFEFEAEVRVPEGEANSGFMFRAHVDTNRVYGYQAEVDPSPRRWSGGLYDEGRRGWLHPAQGDSLAGREFREYVGTAFDRDTWNRYRIQTLGDSLKIWVNGILTTAYRDTVDAFGHIGLQHHGEEGQVYRFRNIRVREERM